MKKNIWFMGGLSSQRDIISGVKNTSELHGNAIQVFASHHQHRYEILEKADVAFIEPSDLDTKMAFIRHIVKAFDIEAIHTGRSCLWFEQHRAAIEGLGVKLTTGAQCPATFALADNKVEYAAYMAQKGLPVVPSIQIASPDELREWLANPPFDTEKLCIKPVTGIYGMGFWKLDQSISAMDCFDRTDNRVVHPDLYLAALERTEKMQPMVLMPYLPGPESSVDMLVEKGKVIAAVARRKEGSVQHLHQSGAAFELAKSSAELMQADGLVNVQTRCDHHGQPLLLEINLRPSGGIGYPRHSGVNLPGLFALRQLDLMSQDEVSSQAVAHFKPVSVRAMTDALPFPAELQNLTHF
ncbi:ATP-grasp domain-containing protein [Yersinia wautersii]|uniref:Carbamoyl phosphate synthase-like protein n=1 Tax=Yersinia wautersii TaxID=1341643 RepID=A0ABP1ZHP6_9GAMM|nr:ATP-grasp domain-containing protein [Yersinia wautersii]CRG50772.1 carbamoyl phosphate synthase-like protein [Yersinia wautersii]